MATRLRRLAPAILCSLSLVLASGCGGDPPPAIVSISITPTQAAVVAGQTVEFTAAVTGTTNIGVTWSVQENGGGTVSGAGLYTAPSKSGTYHVVVTAAADATKSAVATVTVSLPPPPPVSITVSPTSAAVVAGGTQTFIATVTGSANLTVTWSITEVSGGSITNGGVYTAPGAAGTYHVVATSVADTTKFATATVTVSSAPLPVAVSVTPTSVSLATGGTQTFIATVTGSANLAVTWSITEASGGSITNGGGYSAPNTPGTYHVVATSVADNTKFATATVTVSASSATSLAYTDPSSGTYRLRRNPGLSTATHLVLDLVGSGAPSGTAVAFTLTADTAFASWSKVAGGDPELVENGAVLTLGSGVQALKGKAAGGTLSAVVGQKGLGSPVALNGAIARVALDLKSGAGKGAVALASPKAQVLAGGTIGAMTITIGTLAAQ